MLQKFNIFNWLSDKLKPLDDLGEVRICPENINTKSISNNVPESNQQKPL